MRWRIRSQLLVPLLILLLGVIGISTWTAFSSAQHARHRLETQMRDISRTANEVTLPRNAHILKWLHGLSEAEFLLQERAGGFLSTLNLQTLPESLSEQLVTWVSVWL